MITAHRLERRSDLSPIPVRADPNGLAFDQHAEQLFVADAQTGAILRLDGDMQRKVATIDSGGVVARSRIGGVAVTPYGTLFVTRLGYGRAGAVVRVEPDGSMEALERLPVEVWRIGLVYDAHEHALYVAQFRKAVSGPYDGAIVKLDLATGDAEIVVEDLHKPVGVAKVGDALVVTDARARMVYRCDRTPGRAATRTVIAHGIDRPDSVVAASPDSVYVTTFDEAARQGAVRQIWLDGRARIVALGPWEPRGIATDGDRIFVSARRAGRIVVVDAGRYTAETRGLASVGALTLR